MMQGRKRERRSEESFHKFLSAAISTTFSGCNITAEKYF